MREKSSLRRSWIWRGKKKGPATASPWKSLRQAGSGQLHQCRLVLAAAAHGETDAGEPEEHQPPRARLGHRTHVCQGDRLLFDEVNSTADVRAGSVRARGDADRAEDAAARRVDLI